MFCDWRPSASKPEAAAALYASMVACRASPSNPSTAARPGTSSARATLPDSTSADRSTLQLGKGRGATPFSISARWASSNTKKFASGRAGTTHEPPTFTRPPRCSASSAR